MPRIKPATRIAITLGFISATLVWIAHGLNLIPSPNANLQDKRLAIVKTLAGSITGIASQGSSSALKHSLELSAGINSDVLSIGVRGKSGYLGQSENHESFWQSSGSSRQTNQVELEIFANEKLWGTLQVCFADRSPMGMLGYMFPLSLVIFVSVFTTLFAWYVLSRSFRYLNPSKVVPKRVRSAFDTLTEGLVLIDGSHEIAHANKAFGEILDLDAESLVGKSLNELGWKTQVQGDEAATDLPWFQCLANEASVTGRILEIGENETRRKFFVNSAPIFANESECRGAMISFDDVTEMERKKIELAALVKTLRSSRDEVERQNQQLTFLASYDPLTQCLNRRAFWIEFEELWANSEPFELSLLIIDVDHFKSFNDTYGHSFGDLVLKQLGETLRRVVADLGITCRFGGEEFVVALSGMVLSEALEVTHSIHKAIETMDVDGKNVTASIGFSNREFKAMDGQHMLDQADLSLYAAKRNGRNRVMRFDECDGDDAMLGNQDQPNVGDQVDQNNVGISNAAVKGLLKAIEIRCQATADHSTRVAQMCTCVGESLLNSDDLDRLKVAALLHELGKIGVPDSILYKPSELSAEDWQVINQHRAIGLQLARSVVTDSVVSQIIEAHQKTAQGKSEAVRETLDLDESTETCVAIIAVCDEFDLLTNSSVSRDAMHVDHAIARIQRNTPQRFRADVVDKLVEHIESPEAKLKQLLIGGIQNNLSSLAIETWSSEELERLSAPIAEDGGTIESNADPEIRSLQMTKELLELCSETRSAIGDDWGDDPSEDDVSQVFDLGESDDE